MTDRVKGFTVTLTDDIRIDDVEAILNAVRCIKGVLHVEPSLSTHQDFSAQVRVKSEIREKLHRFMRNELSL